jgi:hypothetical protein
MLRSRAITAGLKSIGFEPLTGAYAPGEIGGPETVDLEPAGADETPNPEPAPPPPPKAPLTVATANTRAAALDRLGCQEEGVAKVTLHKYLVALGWLEADKAVEQWPYRFVPLSATELEAVRVGMTEFSQSGVAALPYAPHGIDTATLQAKPVAPPTWESFVMPFGKSKGTALGKLDKSEMDYYVQQFEVKTEVNGIALPPDSVASQKALRAALDEAAAHLAKQP